jgi:hypothetical protein
LATPEREEGAESSRFRLWLPQSGQTGKSPVLLTSVSLTLLQSRQRKSYKGIADPS